LDLSCTGRVEAALALAQQVHEDALAADNQVIRASAASHLAWYCFMQGYYEEGLLHVLSACDFYAALGDRPRESWARGIHAWLLIEVGSPNEALDEAIRALELAESAKEERALCFAQNVVGVVFWMLGQLDSARQFADRAVTLARMIGDEVDLARWLINLADIEAALWKQQQAKQAPGWDTVPLVGGPGLDRAISYAEEALLLTQKTGDAWAGRLVICSLTDFHLLSGKREQAAQTLALWDQVDGGTGTRSRIYHLFTLGKVQISFNEPIAAIATLGECASLTEELSDLEIGVPCCQILSEVWSMEGNYAEALRWHREFHARYVRKSTETALVRSRVAAIQYETRHLQASVEAERSRADGLEEMNRALAQEAAALMTASMEDVLTGLPNRRGLERALLAIATQHDTIYAFAMIDIDHFKQVNDRLSHAFGDEVLRQVANLLKIATRARDRLFRYGGEEFVLLMEEADVLTAARTCKRICQMIRNWNWAAIHPTLRITLSVGIARSEEAKSPAEVLALADSRLYEAKTTGRDRVVMSSHRSAEPFLTPSARLH
jgi:two-component system cell cycle response regulator